MIIYLVSVSFSEKKYLRRKQWSPETSLGDGMGSDGTGLEWPVGREFQQRNVGAVLLKVFSKKVSNLTMMNLFWAITHFDREKLGQGNKHETCHLRGCSCLQAWLLGTGNVQVHSWTTSHPPHQLGVPHSALYWLHDESNPWKVMPALA